MNDFCAPLAASRFGEIRRCQVGCTHLTYAGASIHFECFDEFLHFAEMVSNRALHPRKEDSVEICYHWITIKMSKATFGEMAQMVNSAVEEAAWVDGELTAEDLPDLSYLQRNLPF